jgi:acyl-coenzyme A thioesterase PaaI-like protein
MKEKNQPLPHFPTPEEVNAGNRGTLMETLGISFTHLSPGRCEAVMPVEKSDKALLCLPLDYIAGTMMVVRAICAGL